MLPLLLFVSLFKRLTRRETESNKRLPRIILSFFGIFQNRIDNYPMSKDQKYNLFQKALVMARLENHLTQQEVAFRLKKPQSFISKYESGERRLDVIEFLEVCDALCIKPNLVLKKLGVNDD